MKGLMKLAHEIAKQLDGDYLAKMSMALKTAWARKKEADAIEAQGTSVKFSKCTEWQKGNAHRFYIDGILNQAVRFNIAYATMKKIEFSAYYDLTRNEVVFMNCVQSKKPIIEEFIREEIAQKNAA